MQSTKEQVARRKAFKTIEAELSKAKKKIEGLEKNQKLIWHIIGTICEDLQGNSQKRFE